MKRCLVFLSFLFVAAGARALPPASYADTLHASKYVLTIDTINYSAKSLRGQAEITLVTKIQNPASFRLSLLKMTVDSAFIDNAQVFFTYDDTTLVLPAPGPMNPGDSVVARIHYHGMPPQDASGWGGFYFSGTTAFNLGVGFAADPHVFGRAWFPCIDVFDDKALFEFYITTPGTYRAFCNGVETGQIANPNGTVTWHWEMNDPIPSYLACMAVAPYIIKEADYNGLPVQWACFTTDTNNINNTFQHFNLVMDAFTMAYGPYPFDKVGYALVPFNSGAMEHATAIAIGRAYINGSLTYETLWAHELSHMWWGDKVTCRTAGDMWLNEGWASYNEAFMTEHVYGQAAYDTWIHANHQKVLQFAHCPQNDGSYLAMNALPHAHTYGMHAYQKGADVIHTLRNYMGDSAFFQGCQYYLNNRAYGNASSADLRDDLTAGGGVDMTRFFDDWIFTPGWPHFSIDSVVYQPGGLDHYFVYTRQRSRGNNNHIYAMPVDITFSNGISDTTVTVVIDSATQVFHIPLIGVFTWTALDRGEKISDASVTYERTIVSTGTYVMNETGCSLSVIIPGTSPSTIRVEHNYVTPDGFKQSNPGIRLSDYHYYRIDGVWPPTLLAGAEFKYDGSPSVATGYLDNNLITGTEDSLVLLYRQGTWDDWTVVPAFTLVTGTSKTDKRGTISTGLLQAGEYVFGYYDYTVGTQDIPAAGGTSWLSVAPNPSSDSFTIQVSLPEGHAATLAVFDARGGTVFEETVAASGPVFWHSADRPAGIYFVSLFVDGRRKATQRLVVAR